MLKVAIAGFRHSHIIELVDKTRQNPDLELVGCAESDPAVRDEMNSKSINIEWLDPQEMLAKLPCDIVGLGDVYARRGALAIAALKAGKHVIADKPLCTSLEELQEIRQLAAEKNLCVGLMLPLWSSSNAAAARKVVRSGKIGEVQSVVFTGQHPLNYGTRPAWYFQAGQHGGTINDIAPHGIDLVEFVTGLKFESITAARCWNDHFPEVAHFKNGAQFMAVLSNGAGVMADVSYFACHFGLPGYWRFSIWGTKGWIEFNCATPGVKFSCKESTAITDIFPEASGTDYLKEFLKEIKGEKPEWFSTQHILDLTEFTLKCQQQADAI
ncbi:MAG: Gfo/Idh/MocA family oxidoreductase [Lentisphaerae bacterium]|nr:Gfo/Idh/MocA family oxidoreductase [Lentisphaerota bacterium]